MSITDAVRSPDRPVLMNHSMLVDLADPNEAY